MKGSSVILTTSKYPSPTRVTSRLSVPNSLLYINLLPALSQTDDPSGSTSFDLDPILGVAGDEVPQHDRAADVGEAKRCSQVERAGARNVGADIVSLDQMAGRARKRQDDATLRIAGDQVAVGRIGPTDPRVYGGRVDAHAETSKRTGCCRRTRRVRAEEVARHREIAHLALDLVVGRAVDDEAANRRSVATG